MLSPKISSFRVSTEFSNMRSNSIIRNDKKLFFCSVKTTYGSSKSSPKQQRTNQNKDSSNMRSRLAMENSNSTVA